MKNFTPKRSLALAVSAALAMGVFAPAVFAQATTGAIFGDAPIGNNETVQLVGDSGITRTVNVDAKGRYTAGSLPLGNYTVSLMRDGTTIDSRKGVAVLVGGGTQVSFASASAGTTELSAVSVSANALPAIDVSQVDSRTVITSQQLAKLPLQRSAEAIATLAPGVNQGSSYFEGPTGQQLNSFGGSSIAENAYYLNGMNTSDPLKNFGGLTLPYGAIDQEQVLTGGYGAQYGRSDGGVINQVGKRGTNEWHFGAQILFQPSGTAGDPTNAYYPSGGKFLANADGGQQGNIYRYRNDNKSSTETVDGYFGGPLIKDKLFIFGAVEAQRQYDGKSVGSVENGQAVNYSYNNPKYYAKLDWNITDSNILELTTASNKSQYTNNVYAYNYPTVAGKSKGTYGDYLGPGTYTNNGAETGILKYTSYITDDLTVDFLYGKLKQTSYSRAGGGPDAEILNAQNQDPALNGGTNIVGPQTVGSVANPGAEEKSRNMRLDINWKVGSHSITGGIDNLDTSSIDVGSTQSGPGYSWEYGSGNPNIPISTQRNEGVAAPGGNGYYVDQYIFNTGAAKVRVSQRAQFLQDEWQVSDRVLLSIGIRNDQFTNYNPDSQPYLRLTRPNWAPRLGASWDVFGDSSMKVYANAGRYYLDEPANVAIRGASGSTFTRQYFTYTGIDPTTGAPTGLTQIPQDHYPGVSANAEFGASPDPKTVTSKNVSAEYQDEYIAGLDKGFDMMGSKWTAGVKGTYRVLRNALDDVCDDDVFDAEGVAQGFTAAAAQGADGCYIQNPGKNSTYTVPNANGIGYGTMTIPWSAFNQPDLKRKYLALDTYLEHPFDGTWYGRLQYTASHSFGNTEGSVRSDIGQTDVSQTEDWDNQYVMTYANGDQSNDRRHQIKAIGYYQINPEWLIGGNLQMLSGTPITCLGYYGVDQGDPAGYGASYHFCGPNGTPAAPGKTGRTPWQTIVSLNAEYRPAFADHKLAFSVLVYNIANQQKITQYYNTSESGPGVTAVDYLAPISYEQPRYVQFGISYDF